MSVTVNVEPTREGRPHPGLQEFVQRWFAVATVTGDVTGGQTICNLRFNPADDPKFQPYVALDKLSMIVTAADPASHAEIIAVSTDWERADGLDWCLGHVVLEPAKTAGRYTGVGPLASSTLGGVLLPQYLGRVSALGGAGSTGEIAANLDNTNLCVYRFHWSGWMSDRPFAFLGGLVS